MDKPRIVVVDGDPKNLQILRESLESADFEVTTSGNGEDAWTMIQTRRPDIIVSEVDIPGIDGFQLLQRLQGDPGSSAIPMVFLTNRRNLQDRIKSLRTGVKDYMIKPLHVKEVIARLQMILRRLESLQNDDSGNNRKIVGRLEDSSVEKLVESYGAEQKTGVLSLYDHQNRNGEIYFRNGSVVNARLDSFRAEKAVYQMLPWDNGHFIMTLKDVNVEDEITVSNLGLLLQGFKRSQEQEKLLAKLPSTDTILVRTRLFDQILKRKAVGTDALQFIALFDGYKPLDAILTESNFDELKTLQRVTRLYQQGFIAPVEDEPQDTPLHDTEQTQAPDTALEPGLDMPDMDTKWSYEPLHAAPRDTELTQRPEDSSDQAPAPESSTEAMQADPVTPESEERTEDIASPDEPSENMSRPVFEAEEADAEDLIFDDTQEDTSTPKETRTSEVGVQSSDEDASHDDAPLFEISDDIELEQPFDLETEEIDLSDLEVESSTPEPLPLDTPETEDATAERENEEDTVSPLPGGIFEETPSHQPVPDKYFNGVDSSEPAEPEFITEEPVSADTTPVSQTEPTLNGNKGEEYSTNGSHQEVEATPVAEPNPLSAASIKLCQARGLKKGQLVVLSSNREAQEKLVAALTADQFSTRQIDSSSSLLLGKMATGNDYTVEVVGLSTEKKFLQLLHQVSDKMIGCIILVVGDSSTGLGYLGYLLNSLKGTLKAPSVVAVYQPEGERRVPLEFIRYSLKMDEGEQIMEIHLTEPDSLQHMLAQLQAPAYSSTHLEDVSGETGGDQ